ncbi:MAG TPA: hypothetical protein VNC61_16155 [Acidimicrobiales bacterium]|nr:hypothetical protein [Acidimicrobiales bacterium]
MTDARLLERRFRTTDPMKPGTRLCRVCLSVVVLEPGFLETTVQYVYIRCPHCGGSFPIRHSDAQALMEQETEPS